MEHGGFQRRGLLVPDLDSGAIRESRLGCCVTALAYGVDNGLQELVHLVRKMFLGAEHLGDFRQRFRRELNRFDKASTTFGGIGVQFCPWGSGCGNRRVKVQTCS